MRTTIAISIATIFLLNSNMGAAVAEEHPGWTLLPNADLSTFREPHGEWTVAGDAALDPLNPNKIAGTAGGDVAINGEEGDTVHLVSVAEHGDVEAHIEFMIAKESNSGVYFQGRYEIQILDSYGNEELTYADCGGVYQRWAAEDTPEGEVPFVGKAPRENASKQPGKWQTYDVIFKAPRFDEAGNKISDAEFVKVVHNGVVIHENVKVSGPTRAAIYKDEQPKGPLMLQGDHGPVAYRNVTLTPIDLDE